MKWIEVKVITNPEAAEAVTSVFYDIGVTGVVIEDPKDILDYKGTENDWDYLDPKLANQSLEEVIVKGYLCEGPDLSDNINFIRDGIANIAKALGDSKESEIFISDVYEEDWANEWKKHYKPIKVSNKIVIKPTWEEYEKGTDEEVIELDPGMAFGTGTHETTCMCINLIERFISQGDVVADIGCGSGILAIAAGKLGASIIDAVDLDSNAVRVAKENVELNNLQEKITVFHGNLAEKLKNKYNIIVANIIADVIIGLCDEVEDYIISNGIFITSGIIKDRLEDVLGKMKEKGFELLHIEEMGEWNAVAVRLPKGGA